MRKNNWVVAYGFEYDKVIICDNNCRIGRTIYGKNPIYCALFIEDSNIKTIIEKIKLTEKYREHYLGDFDKLAKRKNVLPKWHLVNYDKDFEYYIHVLQGKMINYHNSEFEPCF
jgi:hypothetical protein